MTIEKRIMGVTLSTIFGLVLMTMVETEPHIASKVVAAVGGFTFLAIAFRIAFFGGDTTSRR